MPKWFLWQVSAENSVDSSHQQVASGFVRRAAGHRCIRQEHIIPEVFIRKTHQHVLDCRQIVLVWLVTVVLRAIHSNSPQHCLPPALVPLPICMYVYRTSSASRNNSQSPDIPSAQPDMEYQTWSFGMPQSMSDSRRDRTTRPPSSGRAENLTCHRNQTESDMEIRHASILALSAKLRVG